MFVKLLNVIILLFFALVPFFFLYHFRTINATLRAHTEHVKAYDLITPYLLLSIWKMSSLALTFKFHYYYMLGIVLIGIALASYYVFKRKELIISKFLRVWWRIVFLISFPMHIVLSVIALYRYIF